MAKVVKKGKKKRKPKKPSEKWKKYNSKGKLPEAKFCPRCGPGIFLAKHGNRLFCGRCHYTEFVKS